jgi:predicted dehydrogenase
MREALILKAFQIVVAGCGGMARTWVEYALQREDCEIIGLVDIRIESAQAMAERYGLTCGVFTDVTEAINRTGANLVFDITIPESHYKLTSKALSLGCHVLGEKPMATSFEEAEELVRIAQRCNRTHAIMQNRRYLKNIRAYRDIIASNTIGQIGFIGADFFIGAHFGGFRDAMESPLILDMAIHTFDQARFITGQDPVSVYCHEFNPAGSWYEGNAAALCIYEFADGSVFNYRGMWCAEGVPTSWEADWRMTGSKGTAMWNGKEAPYYEVVKPANEQVFMNQYERVVVEPTWNGNEGHRGCLDEMFQALIEQRKPETDSTDNIKSMAMVYGALQSAKEGRKVALSKM